MVKPNIVVTVNHNATALSTEHLIVPHASVSGGIVLEANEDTLAHFPMEYGCASSDLAIA
jgi:hypothetical protein